MKDIFVLVGTVLTLLMVALLTQGCVSVTIPDSQWCGDQAAQGATCFSTLTPGMITIPKPQWDAMREGMVCTQNATFASWKGIIEKLCHAESDCDYQKVSAFLDKASALSRHP